MNRPFLNIAGYRFVALPDAAALRDRLFQRAQQAGLKGTVLLAEEGLNLCLAGPPAGVADWLAVLRGDARFADLACKESWSDTPPFKRLKVKLKQEIIRINQPAIRGSIPFRVEVDITSDGR